MGYHWVGVGRCAQMRNINIKVSTGATVMITVGCMGCRRVIRTGLGVFQYNDGLLSV